jgi:hypothetical protein
MTTTRDIGWALGLCRFGRTDSGPWFACGSPGFTAQGHGGPTLVTCHAGSSDRNHARASLPKQGKQHAALTLWRKAVPALAALPSPNMSDPAAAQRGLALVDLGRCGWNLAI